MLDFYFFLHVFFWGLNVFSSLIETSLTVTALKFMSAPPAPSDIETGIGTANSNTAALDSQ